MIRNNGAHICNNSMKSSNSARMSVPPGPSPSARYLSVSAMKNDGISSRLEPGLFTLCRLAKPYSLQLLGFIAKKSSPDKVETENWEKQGDFAEFVAKQRLHSIKGDHQPLTPVPIDLQLGSPPHEIQAFNLGTIEGSYKVLQFSPKKMLGFPPVGWQYYVAILFRKLKFGDPWVLPKICLWPQDVVHGLQVILSSN